MAEVARRRRRAAPVKLPSSTTANSTRSWSTLGVPGACISNLLKRTFRFIRIFPLLAQIYAYGSSAATPSRSDHAEGWIDRREHPAEPVRRYTRAMAGRGSVSAARPAADGARFA